MQISLVENHFHSRALPAAVAIFLLVAVNLYVGTTWYIANEELFPLPLTNYASPLLVEHCINSSYCTWTTWDKLPNKMEKLELNAIYKHFDIPKPMVKHDIDVVVVVSSAPTRLDRRMGIRDTWWTDCIKHASVSIVCYFLTDEKEANSTLGKSLLEESDRYKDIKFQNLQGGHDFGKRFLYHMLSAMTNFNFKYFLRLDDDYFICMKRFLVEIPMPPPPLYHWGWVHCIEDIVRPEDSIILFSRDLVELYLGQDPNKMLCHLWGDQMIGVWKNDLSLTDFFYNHDTRIHHHPPVQYVKNFETRENICDDFIGLHGSYEKQMRMLWQHRGKEDYSNLSGSTFHDFSAPCSLTNVMYWDVFLGKFRAEPKLCRNNLDLFEEKGSVYVGRDGK